MSSLFISIQVVHHREHQSSLLERKSIFTCPVLESNVYFSRIAEVHKPLLTKYTIYCHVSIATHANRIFLAPYCARSSAASYECADFFVIVSQAAQFQEKNYLPLKLCFEFLYHFT